MKLALVMTADAGMLPGVNGMLNALKYYGDSDKVEFHLLYYKSDVIETYISMIKASGHFPNFRAIDVMSLMAEGEEGKGAKYYLKFYRTRYAARLLDYNAVAFFDADRFITNTIYPGFLTAIESGKIVMVDYKFNKDRLDAGFYDKYPIQATNGCPFDPSITYFVPSIWGSTFEKVSIVCWDIGRSEMPSVNYVLIMDKLLEEIVGLRTEIWNLRRMVDIRMTWRFDPTTQKHQMILDDTGEHVCAIHGRWWYRAVLQRKLSSPEQMTKKSGLAKANYNIQQIWEVIKFFNFHCWTTPDWQDSWATDNDYIVPEEGILVERG